MNVYWGCFYLGCLVAFVVIKWFDECTQNNSDDELWDEIEKIANKEEHKKEDTWMMSLLLGRLTERFGSDQTRVLEEYQTKIKKKDWREIQNQLVRDRYNNAFEFY